MLCSAIDQIFIYLYKLTHSRRLILCYQFLLASFCSLFFANIFDKHCLLLHFQQLDDHVGVISMYLSCRVHITKNIHLSFSNFELLDNDVFTFQDGGDSGGDRGTVDGEAADREDAGAHGVHLPRLHLSG